MNSEKPHEKPDSAIDRVSFMLGMITAFGECVGGESRRCAFSPPFYPSDYLVLKEETERIARELHIELWLERNEEIREENRVMWWVFYKFPEVLDAYRELRAAGFNPAYEFNRFNDLLGYGHAFGEHADAVSSRMRLKTDTMDTVTRILFQPGDWPLPPDSREVPPEDRTSRR